MVGAELIRGERGCKLLKYNGFIYRTSNRSSWKTHWQCVQYRRRLCRAILWTYKDGHCELRAGHNHPPSHLEKNNNDTAIEHHNKTVPECTSDVHPFGRKEPEVSRSSLVGSASRSSEIDLHGENHQRPWRRKTTEAGDECGRVIMKRKEYQSSVGESLKLQPRKRVKLYRTESGEDEDGDDNERSGPRRNRLDGTHPSVEKWEPNEEYEVEAIRDIVRNPDGTLKLLVKWKNWPETTNSWEPFSNTKCYDAIVKFLVIRDDSKYMPFVLHEYVQEKFKSPDANIVTVCQLLETGFDLKTCLLLDYREKLRLREILRELKRKSLLHRVRRHFGNPLKFVRTIDGQQNLRSALRELQEEFCSNFKREPLVHFENVVDFDVTPVAFTKIEDYSYAVGVSPRENGGKCKCSDCSDCTCADFDGGGTTACQNYNIDGRLAEHARTNQSSIFECGLRCCCLADCYNRVTQRGRPVEVTVFKTGKEKGWGLRPNSAIEAWTFVLEYLGAVEHFDSEVSDDDFPYVYELVADGEEEPSFVIDSSEQGNVSRFINHSCNPNLIALRVFNQHRDLNIPRLALFACRDIQENEELTFDYRSMKVSKASRSRRFGFKCCCQETNCCGEL